LGLHGQFVLFEPETAPLALVLALFLAGLAGSVTHCVGMCGPFVIAQVTARVDVRGYGTLQRLRGAALFPYHLGRLTTYAVLGAAGASMTGFLANLPGFRVLSACFLAAAAWALIATAAGRGMPSLPSVFRHLSLPQPSRFVRACLVDPRGWRGFALGMALGFLPCGLLYAALAAASTAGSPLLAAVAMASFAIATAPGLFGVGWAGLLFGRRWRRVLDTLGSLALIASAALLLASALRLLI
jgi:sulfite exporter TauE/SafE